jgi:hypothetical protein
MDTFHLLCQTYGPLMHSRDVQAALRYRTAGGFRAARHLGTIHLNMFAIPGRRGLFAKTEDVAELMRRMLAGHIEEAAM